MHKKSIYLTLTLIILVITGLTLYFRNGLYVHAAGTPIVREELFSTTGVNTNIITTGVVQNGTEQLYLATIANAGNKMVTSVSGLGLTWSRAKAQCSGRNTTGIDIWKAFGSPASAGPVTVTFAASTKSAVVNISRYSGTDPTSQVESAEGSNTRGQNGVCSGGVDGAATQLSLTSSLDNSVLFVATTSRNKTISTADSAVTQRIVTTAGTGGDTTRLYLHDGAKDIAGTEVLNHILSGNVDWAMDGLVIRPRPLLPTDTPTPTPTIDPLATPTLIPDTPTPTPTTSSEAHIMVGVGDIASCSSSGDEATANLLDSIPGTVFTTGDNVYEDGTTTEFMNCYEPSWGRHKSRTRPSVGNHEYQTPNASGYFNYFGAAAGDPSKGYYSYDVGSWHVVVLNSNCSNVACTAGSAQEQWLRADLAANPTQCTLAYWHHPLFSSSGSSTNMRPLYQALYDYDAELVLAGHRHNYERFAPQTPQGVVDEARGIQQIVAGMGGESHASFANRTIIANSLVRNDNTYGVLKLTLRPDSYDWEFVPVAGGTFADSGTRSCH